MSGQPAARVGDKITCSTPQTTPAAAPHAPTGSPIIGVGALTVDIGGSGKRAARMGDFSLCPSPVPLPNMVISGAFPVPIEMMPAARMTDQGTAPHVGAIAAPCCPNVLIGLAGTTGNPFAGNAACQALSSGRTGSNTSGQSYNNCGIESSRQLINQSAGSNFTEDALMQAAKSNPAINTNDIFGVPEIGVPGGPNILSEGGTTAQQQVSLLSSSGVPASPIAPLAGNNGVQLSQYELPLSQGRGVIAHGDVSGFPASMGYGNSPNMRGHAVTVTGFDYDDAGNITNVHYNDTNSMCNQTIPKSDFSNFLNTFANRAQANGFSQPNSVVTNNPVW